MEKALVISVSGKGGVGKTTLVALLLKTLLEQNDERDILVVDADPAANLPDILGMKVEKTVGMVANELKRKIEKGQLPIGVSKSNLLEAWVYSTLLELENFDMLVMGRTEGEGCYCYVNSILTRILDTLLSNYDLVLMDMEAGLEHLSRRTDKDVDVMVIVTDPSLMGFKTALRIKELAEEVHIEVKKIYIVGNRFPPGMEERLREWASKIGVEAAGVIPNDPLIAEYNLTGKSLLDLPPDSPALSSAREIAKRIGIIS
ncbi:MAG: ATP-binding protein [Thermoprotei archaeon]|nr:MAG: ATP-binding protein [Thermoprotei archaeon]